MKYAKLLNQVIQFAPNPIAIGDRQIGNPPAEIYLSEGYKPVTYTDPPGDPDPGYIWVSSWVETDESIVQTWEQVEEPDEVDSERAMEILFGGEN